MYTIKDNKIYFDKDFKIDDLEFLGKGANAEVYKVKIEDKWYALKIFSEKEYWRESSIENKTEINLDSFISPLKLVYINGEFSGYIMKLCKSKNLIEENLEFSIDDIIMHSIKLYEDTEKLSEMRFIIQDEGAKNTILENGFKILDIDHFYKPNSDGYFKDIDTIKKFNRETITRLLIKIYFNGKNMPELYYVDDKLKEKRDACLEGEISLEEFLKNI